MSITGQVGHIALAKQTAFGTPNTTAAQYKAVKITGDSLVASNNPLVAEGEIGTGRDVTQTVPGGFSSAGAINGNLRARAAAAFLYGSLGAIVAQPAGTPVGSSTRDDFNPADVLPVWTLEKKVGTNVRTAAELLTLRYTDTMVNTLNITATSGGLSTFSAGLIAAGELYIPAPLVDETVAGTYPATSDDLLVFHGGRIRVKDSVDNDNVTFVIGDTPAYSNDTTFQSLEVSINNNVQSDEYTIRPSRFLRSLTEGIRAVEVNMTLVFEDFAKYQKYTYGATGLQAPGYSLYMGAIDFTLANWQLIDADTITTLAPTGAPTNPQGVDVLLPKVAFSGLPVALASGRIQVSTTGRALKPSTGNIIKGTVRPTGAAF